MRTERNNRGGREEKRKRKREKEKERDLGKEMICGFSNFLVVLGIEGVMHNKT